MLARKGIIPFVSRYTNCNNPLFLRFFFHAYHKIPNKEDQEITDYSITTHSLSPFLKKENYWWRIKLILTFSMILIIIWGFKQLDFNLIPLVLFNGNNFHVQFNVINGGHGKRKQKTHVEDIREFNWSIWTTCALIMWAAILISKATVRMSLLLLCSIICMYINNYTVII